ncbi:OmpA family protein [bacterium]|nr:OmpA family protein [bacterium]HPF36445.1 OmpA family protein [Candidatus Krumholzibacteria bacterium]HRX52071.1 OmpA family protein [Candidatus Krumholzibacteria bacterium]
MIRSVAVALAVALLPVIAASADVEGAADHPLITRYPGSEIAWYEVDNHRPYKLAVGPVTGYRAIADWIETEGRVTRIYYALDNSGRTEQEVFLNYRKALEDAGFEILAAGASEANTRGGDVGTRTWQQVFLGANPWRSGGAVNEMVAGSATSGGRGSVIARKERADHTAYVAVSVYRFREDRIGALVDVVETAAAETGLVTVNVEAIGRDLEEKGRVVLNGLFFAYDTADLTPASDAALTVIASYLAAQPERRFHVVGHTDARGDLTYNMNLSRDRARAVVEALVRNHGVDRARLEPHGVGPLVPVFSNADDAGRDRNRRVELVER